MEMWCCESFSEGVAPSSAVEDQCCVICLEERNLIPRPAKKWREGTGGSHDPGEHASSSSMSGCEFEAAHGFADHDVSLNGQNDKRPQRHLTC